MQREGDLFTPGTQALLLIICPVQPRLEFELVVVTVPVDAVQLPRARGRHVLRAQLPARVLPLGRVVVRIIRSAAIRSKNRCLKRGPSLP